jgi:hypothetical protein
MDPQLLHHAGAMHLDCTLADAKVMCRSKYSPPPPALAPSPRPAPTAVNQSRSAALTLGKLRQMLSPRRHARSSDGSARWHRSRGKW